MWQFMFAKLLASSFLKNMVCCQKKLKTNFLVIFRSQKQKTYFYTFHWGNHFQTNLTCPKLNFGRSKFNINLALFASSFVCFSSLVGPAWCGFAAWNFTINPWVAAQLTLPPTPQTQELKYIDTKSLGTSLHNFLDFFHQSFPFNREGVNSKGWLPPPHPQRAAICNFMGSIWPWIVIKYDVKLILTKQIFYHDFFTK